MSKNKNRIISVRVTDDTYEKLQEYTAMEHITYSSAIADILDRELNKYLGLDTSETMFESILIQKVTDNVMDHIKKYFSESGADKTVNLIMERFSKRYDNIIQRTYINSRSTNEINENVSVVKEILNCMCNYTAYGPVPDYDCEVVQSAKEKVKKNRAGAKEQVDK